VMKLTFICQDGQQAEFSVLGEKQPSTPNPRHLHERPLYRQRVTVWCAVADFGVIGLHFFEEDGETVTVTSDHYVQMLRNFLEPKLNERGNPAVWLQQGGATAHTVGGSMGVLREMFPGRLISL
jgi:hypothetical protein